MKLNFRQGVYRRKPDAMQFNVVPGYVSVVIDSTESLIATVASGPTKNYLVLEARNVPQAWGPFSGTDTQHLYWEINEISGVVSRGATTLSPIISASEPSSPAVGQMWWDVTAIKMKVWDGTRWREKLRVMAGTLSSGTVLNPAALGSQVGITDVNPVYEAGFILTDGFGKAFRNAANEFFTTTTLVGSPDTGSLVKLEGSQVLAPANEPMGKLSLVCFLPGGRVGLATGLPPNNVTRAPVGIITVPAASGDVVQVETGIRVISADEWNWASSDVGKPLYCSASGQLTLTAPTSTKNVRVGTILSSKSILLSFDWQTSLPDGAGAVLGINTTAPLTKTGPSGLPTLGIPRATDAVDGFMHKDDMARITAIEDALPNKSDVGHGHSIPDVGGLQAALDNKANIVHTHAIGDVVDLQATLIDIDVQLSQKADKVAGAAAGNLASLDASGNLLDSGYDANDFAAVGHSHTISNVTGLQAALDNKADIGHAHVAADVTDLQPLLDAKADFVHTHVAADVTDLQPLLDAKADVAHAHVIADVTDLQLTLDAKSNVGHGHAIGDVTGLQTALDDKADVNHSQPISSVTGLQDALDNKSDVGHGHVIGDVSGLQIALDGKADIVHGHAISDVAGLQTSLDNKSDVGHGHVIDDVSGLQGALDGKANAVHTHTLAGSLNDVDLVNFPPSSGNVLTYNGTLWVAAPTGGGSIVEPLNQLVFGTDTGVSSSNWLMYDDTNGEFLVNRQPGQFGNRRAEDNPGFISIYGTSATQSEDSTLRGSGVYIFAGDGYLDEDNVNNFTGGGELIIRSGRTLNHPTSVTGGRSTILLTSTQRSRGSNVLINAGESGPDDNGGGIALNAGNVSGNRPTNKYAGNINLNAGNVQNGSQGQGGFVEIFGGIGRGGTDYAGGYILIQSGHGNGTNTGSGDLTLALGNPGSGGTPGKINFNAGVDTKVAITYSGSIELAGNAGTVGQVLISQGPSASPVWGVAPAVSSIIMTINNQAGAYTPVLADGDGKTLIRMTSGTAVDFTVPNDTSVNYPVGTTLLVGQAGAGQVTIVPELGVTVNSPETLKIRKQHGKVTITKVAANEWDIEGNLEPI